MALWKQEDTKESAPTFVVDTRNTLTAEERTGTGQYDSTVSSVSDAEMEDNANNEREFAHAGWNRRFEKVLPDGTKRVYTETLVAGGSFK